MPALYLKGQIMQKIITEFHAKKIIEGFAFGNMLV